jgi:hypothetical protein
MKRVVFHSLNKEDVRSVSPTQSIFLQDGRKIVASEVIIGDIIWVPGNKYVKVIWIENLDD